MAAQHTSFAELYEDFYGPAIFRPLTSVFLEHAAPRRGERVLDVACGTGMVARHVAPLVGAEGRVVGVDLNPAMVAVAERLSRPAGASIEWRQGDAGALDLEGEEFDLVVCQQGLQFFGDRGAALRGIRRLLAPGGRIALATWAGIDRQPFYRDLAEVELRHLAPLGVTYEDVIAPFSLGDTGLIRFLLEGNGFTNVSIEARSVTARFPSRDYIRKLETAYGAVLPAFVSDPQAFGTFLDAVESESADLVARYQDGDTVTYPMEVNVTTAFAI